MDTVYPRNFHKNQPYLKNINEVVDKINRIMMVTVKRRNVQKFSKYEFWEFMVYILFLGGCKDRK